MTTTARPKWYDDKLIAYAGRIARLARVFGGSHHEEVAQDIYMDAINRWDRYDQWGRFETEDEARQHAEAFAEQERALVPLVQDYLQLRLDLTRDELASAANRLPEAHVEALIEALTRTVRALSALVMEARNG